MLDETLFAHDIEHVLGGAPSTESELNEGLCQMAHQLSRCDPQVWCFERSCARRAITCSGANGWGQCVVCDIAVSC
jgi:hypothetical protein